MLRLMYATCMSPAAWSLQSLSGILPGILVWYLVNQSPVQLDDLLVSMPVDGATLLRCLTVSQTSRVQQRLHSMQCTGQQQFDVSALG